ncbi:hypothetical protein ENTB45_220 [Enterobacter phage Entb_45]|uniref:Uncharacterized protein n=1 Tax=Enterobacter phage vB_EclM_CIP9 TaxID=2696340 RepID=A0A6B9XZP1_9CAUD|nr:hypothetical protein HWD05_gp264 [Enterobacter phage vB_EclM_CIP9]QHS01800.1 hypothetical protein CPT_CIP9_264 [Enterobacter phage vB_EclM_CIP9]UTY64392.1 hypothetical protein ENTB45_220 [Enterobacter phage Entb_45]
MKRAEAIRNVAALVAVTAFSFSMFAGFLTGLLTTTENMVSLAVTAVVGGIAFLMHNIAK